MHKIEKDCLLDFFESINNKFEYVVMRNGEELPFDNFSNDIDILIDQTKYHIFEKEMMAVFLRNQFDKVERVSFHGIECYTFYNIKNEIPNSIKIDLFFNFEGGGIRYYDFKNVIKFKTINSNGIFVFDDKTESYFTAFKTIAAGGALKEKYLQNFIANNLDDFKVLLSESPSKEMVGYLKQVLITKKNPVKIARKRILFETLLSNFTKYGFTTFSRFFYHYKLEFKRAFSSNKSLVFKGGNIELAIKYINKIKENSRPVLRSNANRIVFIANNKLNIFTSFKYYFIKIIPMQRGDKIIIYNKSSVFLNKSSKTIHLEESDFDKNDFNILSKIIDNITFNVTDNTNS